MRSVCQAHDSRMARFANAKASAAALMARIRFSTRVPITVGKHLGPVSASPTPSGAQRGGSAESYRCIHQRYATASIAGRHPRQRVRVRPRLRGDRARSLKRPACIYFPRRHGRQQSRARNLVRRHRPGILGFRLSRRSATVHGGLRKLGWRRVEQALRLLLSRAELRAMDGNGAAVRDDQRNVLKR